MRTFIIITIFSICQQAFSGSTKCELSIVPSPQRVFNKSEQEKIKARQISNIREKAVELLYTIDSLGLDDSIVMALWTEHSYYILDLVQYTESELLKLKGINKNAVTQIRERLLAKSLHLGMHAPHSIMQEEVKRADRKKHSLHMEFIDSMYGIPTDIPRNEFIKRMKAELEKLNDSHLYHPIKINGYLNIKGTFKNVVFLPHSIKPPYRNPDIRRAVIDQVSFIIMQNQTRHNFYEI